MIQTPLAGDCGEDDNLFSCFAQVDQVLMDPKGGTSFSIFKSPEGD